MTPESPRTVLDEIVSRVKRRLAEDRAKCSLADMKKRAADAPPPVSFYDAIRRSFGLIAEIKRKSPSQGDMLHHDVKEVARIYQDHPVVRAVSILTNRDDFDMSIVDLGQARKIIKKPILRKDFIFHEYQIYEARAHGADAILLMANVVTDPGTMKGFFSLATSLKMDVLFECRSTQEIDSLPAGARIVGINSRKLKAKRYVFGLNRYVLARWAKRTKVSDRDASVEQPVFELAEHIPQRALKIAESGMDSRDVVKVRDWYGYNAALVGTSILNASIGVAESLDQFGEALACQEITVPQSSPHILAHP